MKAHPELDWRALGKAGNAAKNMLDVLNAGGIITGAELKWLFEFTGYEFPKASAPRMCREIIEAYEIHMITLRLTQ